MDVWEHANYLDFHNERKRYAETFLERLACWDFANENLEKAS
jgi:Fe-Mn family superoxide dismutase